MSILGYQSRGLPAYRVDAYLQHHVDGKEAARLLGVSPGRWRQIVGDTEAIAWPGPGTTTAGVRGAKWPMRAVIAYAMANNRKLEVAVPALMPMPEGAAWNRQARYVPVRHVVWNAPTASELVLAGASGQGRPPGRAWAEMFIPSETWRCEQELAPLLLLTPLWPTASTDLWTDLNSYVQKALAVTGWAQQLPEVHELTVVIIPAADRDAGRDWISPMVRAYRYQHDDLRRMLDDSESRVRERNPFLPHDRYPIPPHYEAPAADVAAVLGWSALPWWRYGTTSPWTCSQWKPGHPVEVTVPVSQAGRHEAAKWLQTQGKKGAATKADHLHLAAEITPGRFERSWDPEPNMPAGIEAAVTMRWPAAPAVLGQGTSMFRALDATFSDPRAPRAVGRELLSWVGDPTFTQPSYLAFRDLNGRFDQWADLFRKIFDDAGSEELPDDARWRELEEARAAAAPTASYDVRKVLLGPLEAPALVDADSITWLAPTGYRPEEDNDFPHLALPHPDEQPVEVLLVAEREGAPTKGWVRTATGALMPLPGKSQTLTNNHGAAIMIEAAFAGVGSIAAWDMIRRSRWEDTNEGKGSRMEQLLTEVGKHGLMTATWDDFAALAQDSILANEHGGVAK